MSEEFARTFVDLFQAKLELALAQINRHISPSFTVTLTDAIGELFVNDFCVDTEPEETDTLTHARWQDECNRVLRNRKRAQEWMDIIVEAVCFLVIDMPQYHHGPFSYHYEPSQKTITAFLSPFILATKVDFFKELKPKLMRELERDAHPINLLRGTPLQQLFPVTETFGIPSEKWKEHAAIFAPTGGGKTQTLQALIVDFLKTDTPMFIMDSMGAMLKKIERLNIPPERLVILDPTDEKPPALNFFKINAPPAKQMELFFYLFKAIEQGLTPRQATMVSYLVEYMQVLPYATLDTLRLVCESKEGLPFDQLERLSPIARDFFNNQFYGRDQLIQQTKQQIAARLYTIGRNHVFNEMFSAPENRFDASAIIARKQICLINTDRLFLGDEASAIFGRFIIAQCMAAALSRASIPERERHLALLIVDESKAYLDEQAEKILSDARQFGLGLILATQSPHQLPEGVQREVANNTGIKMLGSVSYSVASQLARDMKTTPDFIQSMQARPPHSVEFATYVRDITPHAIKLSIPIGVLEKEPQIIESAWKKMRERNRERYGTHKAPEGASRGRNNTPTLPQSDIELVILLARRVETLLETHCAVTGRGLHEKLDAAEALLPPKLIARGRYLASVRNRVVHRDGFTLPDRHTFIRYAEEFETYFKQRAASKDGSRSEGALPLESDTTSLHDKVKKETDANNRQRLETAVNTSGDTEY